MGQPGRHDGRPPGQQVVPVSKPGPASPTDLVALRRETLLHVIERSRDGASYQSAGLATRLLRSAPRAVREPAEFDLEPALSALQYQGYPPIAYVGYAIGGGASPEAVAPFCARLTAVLDRDGATLAEMLADDAAFLGVADGVASVKTDEGEGLRDRLVQAAETVRLGPLSRLRALALELLDPRGRLSVKLEGAGANHAALDLVCRQCWEAPYRTVEPLAPEARVELLTQILSLPPPAEGDLERAAAWLVALDALVSEAARSAVPTTDDAVRLLQRTGGALKRWRWEDKSPRKGRPPARWLIDNEYHVQDFLYAILYPLFGAEVLEEQYLRGFGFTQPRYDLAISDLSLIIEVKFARQKRDFSKFEEQIAGDLGLYFGPQSPFKTLAVYVYDDCDEHHPQLYSSFRDALMQRDHRVLDVVVVRRPGMIPGRNDRQPTPS